MRVLRARFVGALPWILCLLACSPARAQRLPTTVAPEHYDLAFDVDLATARFEGVETIKVTLAEPSRRIVLHALEIQFHEVTITAGAVAQNATVALTEATQTAALTVPRAVPAGPAEIHIRYTGILNDKLRGFYLSKANGRNYAVTQFESTDARRAFPSFDEPAFKATFSVTLTIDDRDTAISNGRLVSDTSGPRGGRHTLTFSETPKMSSYLVAMAVGDFRCLEGEAQAVPIRICATPDKTELGRIALDAAQRILTFYNGYYTIKYPFNKLDVVAVPDFAAGAMENTAAIFYREVDLLADSKSASVGNVQRIWSVLAHEMAHQWFGDLVTMKWWNDLWLNEGFATWMEKRPLAAMKPEWKMDVEAVLDTQTAMNLDSLASTRAIHSPVETPDEIEAAFDAIAYEKGAAVMRMIEGYLGAEVFRTGINAYIEQHAYGNATSEDFWTVMTKTSGTPIDRILPTFVNQPGLPLLNATLRCDGGRSQLSVAIERFFIDPAMAKTVRTTPIWEVPLCVKTPDSTTPACHVVGARQATVLLEGPSCARWAFVNAGAYGYVRTSYSADMIRALAPDIETSLTEPERLMIVGDEWALVRAGRHSVGEYLTLASGFGREHASGILGEVSSRLIFIHDDLTDSLTQPTYERFVQSLLHPSFEELGIDAAPGDDDDRRALRATVIQTLDLAGNDAALATAARDAVTQLLSGATSMDPSAANAVVAVAARHGDSMLWDQMLNAAQRASSPAERYRYLYALGAFQDPALIDRGLNLSLTPELRSQDMPTFLARFFANAAAREHAWAFVKQQWNDVAPKVKISGGDVRLIESLGAFCDGRSRDDISAFFKTHKLPAASRALDQTLERINNCIAMRQKETSAVATWLAQR
jgi:aminopeptidase N